VKEDDSTKPIPIVPQLLPMLLRYRANEELLKNGEVFYKQFEEKLEVLSGRARKKTEEKQHEEPRIRETTAEPAREKEGEAEQRTKRRGRESDEEPRRGRRTRARVEGEADEGW